MARLTQAPMTPRRSAEGPDSLTDLNRLLARLQQNILQASAEQERRLRTSEYERNKADTNLEYARTLLTRLEHEALAVKVHTRRQELQADLNRKRDLFDRLAERLRELDDLSIDSDADSSDDGEDLLGGIIQTPSESLDSRSPDRRTRDSGEERDDDDADDADATAVAAAPATTQTAPPPPPPSDPAAATATSGPPTASAAPTPPPASRPPGAPADARAQGLRARPHAAGPAAPPKDAADTAETTGRQRLFGDRADAAAGAGLSATTTTDAILDSQRAEQEQLSESLLGMASALKASSRSFALSLEGEKDILQAAGAGLDRNERGLEAAARRMGTLRRLSEGKGWFGRMMLYAWIFGLMVVAVLLVFVLPKLRF